MDMPDAPPRKPKQPFLKRGEGTQRRIEAYKHRKPLVAVAEAQPAPADQVQDDAPSRQHTEGNDRQSSYSGKSWDHDGVHSSNGHGNIEAPSTQVLIHGLQQAEEDPELEEFRALEREIWGGSQQHGQLQQQQSQQHSATPKRLLSQQSLPATLLPEAAEAAAIAAYGGDMGKEVEDQGVDLSHSSSSQMFHFQDDTEWVDTEFSFAAGLADEVAHMQPQQLQHQHAPPHHKQLARPSGEESSDLDAVDVPVQPYVRAIFASSVDRGGNRAGSAGSRLHQQQHTGSHISGMGPSGCDNEGDGGMQQQVVAVPLELVHKWQQIEAAQLSLQQEKADLRKMRQELEKAAARLDQERQASEKQKAAAQASLEAWRSEEARRLARERRVLEQQSKALLKLPSKKEKSAMEALERQLDKERSEAKAAAARHRLTVERLRCQIKELQDCNAELREEVRWHEAQQLNATAFAASDARARRKPPTSSAQTQTDACLVQGLHPATSAAAAATAMAARLEAEAKWQQGSCAAARDPDSLYSALFGDDEDDADFAAAEEVAAAAALELPAEGVLAVDAAEQHAGNHTVSSTAGTIAAARCPSNRRQQQQPGGVPSQAQLGRRMGNNVTLKPGISWGDSPQKQQQQLRQQWQQWRVAGDDSQDVSCSSLTHAAAEGRRPEGREECSDDTFSFPVAPEGAAALHNSSSSSDWGSPHRHQQDTNSLRQGGGSSQSRLNERCAIDMTRNEASDRLHMTTDAHGQQQQHQHGLSTATHSNTTCTALDDLSDAIELTRSAAAGSAAAYSSSSDNNNNNNNNNNNRSPAATSVGRQLLQELHHPDGKCEQLFSDGSRVLVFANGTSKTTTADGGTCICFTNGDVKRQTAAGRVDYYYAEVATWQSTHPSGVEVFYFPTGQIEGHHADGTLDIIFPDGSIKRVMPDGSEQEITAGLLTRAVQEPPPELDRL